MRIKRVMGNNVLLQLEEPAENVQNGIILPFEEKDTPIYTVITSGNGNLQENDRVIINDYATVKVEDDTGTYYVINESDIIAVIDKED